MQRLLRLTSSAGVPSPRSSCSKPSRTPAMNSISRAMSLREVSSGSFRIRSIAISRLLILGVFYTKGTKETKTDIKRRSNALTRTSRSCCQAALSFCGLDRPAANSADRRAVGRARPCQFAGLLLRRLTNGSAAMAFGAIRLFIQPASHQVARSLVTTGTNRRLFFSQPDSAPAERRFLRLLATCMPGGRKTH